MAGKWNYKTHAYDPYNPKWPLVIMADINTTVHCAACGKELPFGDCYTSKVIHTDMGLGYPVCEDCYNEEIKEEKQNG